MSNITIYHPLLAQDTELRLKTEEILGIIQQGNALRLQLAMKLAEVQMMREVTGESPLLLLDDVMSELDGARRHAMLDALAGVDQALVTTTDWSDFSEELLAHCRRYHVDAGRLTEI